MAYLNKNNDAISCYMFIMTRHCTYKGGQSCNSRRGANEVNWIFILARTLTLTIQIIRLLPPCSICLINTKKDAHR